MLGHRRTDLHDESECHCCQANTLKGRECIEDAHTPQRPDTLIDLLKFLFNFQRSVHLTYILIYIQQDATLHSLFYLWKPLYMSRVVSPPITRSTHNCIYSIWYLSNRYCYLPLAASSSVCAPDDGWSYHPKHVEQFSDINKLCNAASCWIYIGIYLRCTDP